LVKCDFDDDNEGDSPLLKVETSPVRRLGRVGCQPELIKNGVYPVEACTKLLMENSTIGKKELQLGKD
jgi:hypothetical protein